MKEAEQTDLARSVIDKVLKNVQDEKTQREILASAVAEVERESAVFLCIYCGSSVRHAYGPLFTL